MADSLTQYRSAYTGQEIDAAITKASTLLDANFTYSSDAGDGFIIRKDGRYSIVNPSYLNTLIPEQLDSSNISVSSDIADYTSLTDIADGDPMTKVAAMVNILKSYLRNVELNKLDTNGSISNTKVINTAQDPNFEAIPTGQTTFSNFLYILTGWYNEIEGKLSADGDGSSLTVTKTVDYTYPVYMPATDEPISLAAIYNRLCSWNPVIESAQGFGSPVSIDLQTTPINSSSPQRVARLGAVKEIFIWFKNVYNGNNGATAYTDGQDIKITGYNTNLGSTGYTFQFNAIPVGNSTDAPTGWVHCINIGTGWKVERQIKFANGSTNWNEVKGDYVFASGTLDYYTVASLEFTVTSPLIANRGGIVIFTR